MLRLIVKANKLNKRKVVPAFLPDPTTIVGTVNKDFVFDGEEVSSVPNPALGKWYIDKDKHFYWGGGLNVFEDNSGDAAAEMATPDNSLLENIIITPTMKHKIEQIVNVFETGSAEGNYATLVKLRDFNDPETGTRIVQVTYGRSQTTEFGHLQELVQDYVHNNGAFATQLIPFINRIGKKPSLASDDV